MNSTRKFIACLDVADGKVVKGVRFREHEVLGDVLEFAERYSDADELVVYDIAASPDGRTVQPAWLAEVTKRASIPVCVAGGIRSINDAALLFEAGAAKISVNSPALERPDLVRELANEFGSERIVVGIDSELVANDTWRVRSHTGRTETTQHLAMPTLDWVVTVSNLGAGEIVLNSMNNDGVRSGYDIEQLHAVTAITTVPIIASGGAGSVQDIIDVFTRTTVAGALSAGALHRDQIRISDVRRALEAL